MAETWDKDLTRIVQTAGGERHCYLLTPGLETWMPEPLIDTILADHASAQRAKELEEALSNLHMAVESWQTAAEGEEYAWAQRNLDRRMREAEAALAPKAEEVQ